MLEKTIATIRPPVQLDSARRRLRGAWSGCPCGALMGAPRSVAILAGFRAAASRSPRPRQHRRGHMGEQPVGGRRVGRVDVVGDPEAALAVQQPRAAVGRRAARTPHSVSSAAAASTWPATGSSRAASHSLQAPPSRRRRRRRCGRRSRSAGELAGARSSSASAGLGRAGERRQVVVEVGAQAQREALDEARRTCSRGGAGRSGSRGRGRSSRRRPRGSADRGGGRPRGRARSRRRGRPSGRSVDPVAKRGRRLAGRPEAVDEVGEHVVGGDHPDRAGLGSARTRRTISSSAEFGARLRGVRDLDHRRGQRRVGLALEDDRDVVAGPRRPALEPVDEPAIAASRSFHQPSGRVPITFMPSTR